MNIAVLGAGSWGTTLALLLIEKGYDVRLWEYHTDNVNVMRETRENVAFLPGILLPERLLVTNDIDEACRSAGMLVTAVPSQHLRSVLSHLSTKKLSETIICNVAKGIETESLMTMTEVIEDSLPHCRKDHLAVLSGPSHAEEVSKRIPTAIVAASVKSRTAKIVQDVFLTPYFRVYVNEDLRGVELGGSIKNVIAVAAGISDGAGFGDNTKAAIMTRGIYEITRLGVKMGAQPRTFAGLSGIGDLIVTCMSKHSRNRYVGEQVGAGKPLQEVLKSMVMIAEGVPTTKSVHALSQKLGVEMPIAGAVYQVLFEGRNPHDATEDLMTRDAKGE